MDSSASFTKIQLHHPGNPGKDEIINYILPRYLSGLNDLKSDVTLHTIPASRKNAEIKLLKLISSGKSVSQSEPDVFDHVIRIDDGTIEVDEYINESAVNILLKEVYDIQPDVIFISFISGKLEKVFANLLKTAGYKQVIVSQELSGNSE